MRCGSDHDLGWHAGDLHSQARVLGWHTPILTRKSRRGRANGTTGSALAGLRSRGRGKPWLGGGFEGDLVAQCFELADVVAFLAVRAEAVVIEVGPEVVEMRLGVGE